MAKNPMTKQQMVEARRRITDRLAYAVARRLAVPLDRVQIVRWDRDRKTHAEIPVFAVPADRLDEVLATFGIRAVASNG